MLIYAYLPLCRALILPLASLALYLCLGFCCNLALHAEVVPTPQQRGQDSQPLQESIWLDNSDALELVISNTQINPSELSAQESEPPIEQTWNVQKRRYMAEITNAARATNLDPALIHAVIATESQYNAKATSVKGAFGLMQIMPTTALTLSKLPVRKWSTSEQILHGAQYLKRLIDMFDGNLTLALAAYNAGPQAVKNHHFSIPPFAETLQYVNKVLGVYQRTQLHTISD